MALNFDNLIIESIDRFTFKGATTGSIHFIAEDLQNFVLTNGEELVFGTGRAGRRISALKKNKTASISFDNAFVSMGQIAAQTGTDTVEASTATIACPIVEYLTVGSTTTSVATTYTAEGTAGAEIKKIYKARSDRTAGTSYSQGAEVSSTVFTYTPGTKAIALPTGVFSEGDIVIVSYEYLTKGKKISNNGANFSKNGMGILDVTIKSMCDNETAYYGRLVIPSLSSSGQFEINMGGDQTIQAFSGEALPDFCAGGSYWDLIIPEED